jgi:glycosyltransferase involved in cell wall biosynthesis
MKLIIQIPCYNEEQTLPVTLQDLPKHIEGIDEIEVLIVDDGSTDHTLEAAQKHGVNHIVRLTSNQGLARAFAAGLDASLKLGADIIVNTDADNQYFGGDIPRLVQPILERKADMVVGDRQTDSIEHFSYLKRKLQKVGTRVIRKISQTEVRDATSGFRAYSRHAALKIHVFSDFTYTLDTIIQAGKKNLIISSVPVRTNEPLRESRLFDSMWTYLRKAVVIIIRIFSIYRPFRAFSLIGSLFLAVSITLGIRYVYHIFIQHEAHRTYLQSVVLSGALFVVGILIIVIGFIAYLISVNREISEDILARVKRLEIEALHDKEKGLVD